MKKDLASAQREINEAALDDSKESVPGMEELTPLVAGAIDKAAWALLPKNTGWEKAIAKMETAQIEIEKKFNENK